MRGIQVCLHIFTHKHRGGWWGKVPWACADLCQTPKIYCKAPGIFKWVLLWNNRCLLSPWTYLHPISQWILEKLMQSILKHKQAIIWLGSNDVSNFLSNYDSAIKQLTYSKLILWTGRPTKLSKKLFKSSFSDRKFIPNFIMLLLFIL